MEDPEYAEMQRRFSGAISQSLDFAKSQGLMHDIAYAAVDAREWISGLITQHLDEPAASIEKAAHAAIIRGVFGKPALTHKCGFVPFCSNRTEPSPIHSLQQCRCIRDRAGGAQ